MGKYMIAVREIMLEMQANGDLNQRGERLLAWLLKRKWRIN